MCGAFLCEVYMIVKSKLIGEIRAPKSKKSKLASRDFLRRQQVRIKQ